MVVVNIIKCTVVGHIQVCIPLYNNNVSNTTADYIGELDRLLHVSICLLTQFSTCLEAMSTAAFRVHQEKERRI